MNNYEQIVVAGEQLYPCCTYSDPNARFALPGVDARGNKSVVPVSSELLSKHILLLGGIGCGKTNTMNYLINSIRNSMTNDDVMIIFDTKGDFRKEFMRPGDIVISNDATARGSNGPDYWNIFEEVTVDDRVEENILEIAKTLFSDKLEQSSQPFFPNAAKDIFTAVMLEMVRNRYWNGKRTNKDLRDFFDSFNVGTMKNILKMHPDLKAISSYIDDPKSGQTLGVISELQQLVREIFVGNFKKKGSLSIRKLIKSRGKKVIFIEYDLSFGSTLTPVYKLLIDLAIKEALSRSVVGRNGRGDERGNVYFILDEFRLLPKLSYIDNGVNFGRSLGAKFIVGVQNVEQICSAYGKEDGMSLLSGFSTALCFRVNDAESRDYIKGRYGKNVRLQRFMQAVGTKGVSEQLHDSDVIEDSDITSLSVGEAIVCIKEFPPFKFKFNRYEGR